MSDWSHWSRKQFLAAPERPWGAEDAWWDSLLLIPTHRRHDSGYAYFTVVGANNDGAMERLADYDVVNLWEKNTYWNIDCLWPSGVFRVFRLYGQVRYDFGLVESRPRPRKES